MNQTHPPPTHNKLRDKTGHTPDALELNALLPMLLGDTEIVPDGCDVDIYLAMLNGLDVSDGDKRVLIHTLWTLIETVIGIRFGVDPITLELRDRSEPFTTQRVRMVESYSPKPNMMGVDFTSSSINSDENNRRNDERV